MVLFQQVLFLIVIFFTAFLIAGRAGRIRSNILLGGPLKRNGQFGKRLKNVILVAFGQKKMFKKPIPALLHVILFTGFLVVNLEIFEFILDGIIGTHRTIAIFLNSINLSAIYSVVLNVFEFYALGVVLACCIFLIRRNIIKVKRFKGVEMTSWPKLDANLILIFEILLVCAILTMNAADQILQVRNAEGYIYTGVFVISDRLATPFYQFMPTDVLIVIERTAWWFHIIGMLGFAVYVTYSKHLHIFMAFPNVFYSKLEPMGKIDNMPEVTTEVRMMLGLPSESDSEANTAPEALPRLGAKDAADLNWKSLMDAYTCTECGRCTAVCPANETGKKLSPRKIMMDTRDRIEEIGKWKKGKGKHQQDTKSLLGDYISTEELFACTSCNACTEACPVMIDPLSIILQMRRYLSMEESGAPAQWNAMFSNIETSFSPWKFPSSDRFKWAEALSVTSIKSDNNSL